MDDIQKRITGVAADYKAAAKQLDIAGLAPVLAKLTSEMQQPDFWNDNRAAQEVAKKHSALQSRVEPWQKLDSELRDRIMSEDRAALSMR